MPVNGYLGGHPCETGLTSIRVSPCASPNPSTPRLAEFPFLRLRVYSLAPLFSYTLSGFNFPALPGLYPRAGTGVRPAGPADRRDPPVQTSGAGPGCPLLDPTSFAGPRPRPPAPFSTDARVPPLGHRRRARFFSTQAWLHTRVPGPYPRPRPGPTAGAHRPGRRGGAGESCAGVAGSVGRAARGASGGLTRGAPTVSAARSRAGDRGATSLRSTPEPGRRGRQGRRAATGAATGAAGPGCAGRASVRRGDASEGGGRGARRGAPASRPPRAGRGGSRPRDHRPSGDPPS